MDSPGGQTDAAVLVPLYVRDGTLHAIFTKRHDDLRRHPGEISFPGGRPDFPDEPLLTTALRETFEEIGLPPDAVEIVGSLPPVGTFVTGYRVHSFVGLIEPGHAFELQPTEVETVLELPLPAVAAGAEMKRLVRRGVPFRTMTYTVDDQMIWGATGRIVGHLLDRIAPLL